MCFVWLEQDQDQHGNGVLLLLSLFLSFFFCMGGIVLHDLRESVYSLSFLSSESPSSAFSIRSLMKPWGCWHG